MTDYLDENLLEDCDGIDISEGIDLTKSNNRKECMIFHYWFFNHGFKFQESVYNGCHDFTMLSVKISNIVLFIKLANLKQLIYQKILSLKIMGICKVLY